MIYTMTSYNTRDAFQLQPQLKVSTFKLFFGDTILPGAVAYIEERRPLPRILVHICYIFRKNRQKLTHFQAS